jgi:hypothetical protein
VHNRRAEGELTADERDIRTEILTGLIADSGEFNQAIEGVIKNNQKARANPKALAQLDGYKRPLVGSLSANLQRFGMEKVAKMESLQEIMEMTEDPGTSENSSPDCPMIAAKSDDDE